MKLAVEDLNIDPTNYVASKIRSLLFRLDIILAHL
jgi:hypothetical protein